VFAEEGLLLLAAIFEIEIQNWPGPDKLARGEVGSSFSGIKNRKYKRYA